METWHNEPTAVRSSTLLPEYRKAISLHFSACYHARRGRRKPEACASPAVWEEEEALWLHGHLPWALCCCTFLCLL